jgi:hypothetical protein
MGEQWHFRRVGKNKIEARACFKGDAVTHVAPGEQLAGVSYAELAKAAPGVVKVGPDGWGFIMSNEGFYLDESGLRQDAEIHNPILEGRRQARAQEG